MALNPRQANALFNILVKHAGHSNYEDHDRAEFVEKFSSTTRSLGGEYWFTGEFNDFKLIDQWRSDNRYYWTMIKQGGQPEPGSRIAKALEDTNRAIEAAYATRTLRGEAYHVFSR